MKLYASKHPDFLFVFYRFIQNKRSSKQHKMLKGSFSNFVRKAPSILHSAFLSVHLISEILSRGSRVKRDSAAKRINILCGSVGKLVGTVFGYAV